MLALKCTVVEPFLTKYSVLVAAIGVCIEISGPLPAVCLVQWEGRAEPSLSFTQVMTKISPHADIINLIYTQLVDSFC
jgi:hypothetical protein